MLIVSNANVSACIEILPISHYNSARRFITWRAKMGNGTKQSNPNKKYKELKQKQKARIADFMYQETKKFFDEHGEMPATSEDCDAVVKRVYSRVTGLGFWIPYEEVLQAYLKKREHYIERLETAGLPEHIQMREQKAQRKATNPTPQKKPKRKKREPIPALPEQDDRFFFIAGYTSGGAPYGVTWEEMGLEPWEELE